VSGQSLAHTQQLVFCSFFDESAVMGVGHPSPLVSLVHRTRNGSTPFECLGLANSILKGITCHSHELEMASD
jgi:hypothetical protein